MGKLKPFATFHDVVDKFVTGGDLVFIEEKAFFDDYTEMNSQTLHAFKKCLRLKQDLSDMKEIKQWSRIGIVIESDIEEIKYLLELTDEGFKKSEYVSRILELKTNQQTFAIRRQMVPLSYRQSKRLRRIAEFLSSINGESGKYRDLYSLQEDQLQTDVNFMQARNMKKKLSMKKSARGDDDDS